MHTKQELYQLDSKELQIEVEKARKELLKYKIGVKTRHLKANHLIKKYKGYIARLLTIMKELSSPKT